MTPEERAAQEAWGQKSNAARMARARGDLEGAITILEGLIAEDQDDLFSQNDIASVYAALGENQRAYDMFKRVFSRPVAGSSKTDPIKLTEFGEAALSLGHHEEAMTAFREAIANGRFSAGPDYPDARAPGTGDDDVRAEAHVASGIRLLYLDVPWGSAYAAEQFQKAVQLKPNYHGARLYLAKAFERREVKRYAEALQQYKKVANVESPFKKLAAEAAERVEYLVRAQAANPRP